MIFFVSDHFVHRARAKALLGDSKPEVRIFAPFCMNVDGLKLEFLNQNFLFEGRGNKTVKCNELKSPQLR